MQGEAKRVLVTGAAGMLGSQVILGVPDGVTVVGADLRDAPGVEAAGVDLADAEGVAELFARWGPFDGVIHTAAYTAVDKAEEEEDVAQRANATACAVLAEQCARSGAPLVTVSTDFVFDGTSHRPYREDDPPNPLSAYGRTKLAGERAALEAHPSGVRVVRTQWLYGPRGRHFPRTMQQLARERSRLKVVADPALTHNTHYIDIRGKTGNIRIQLENVPSPDNPKTAWLACYSALAAFKSMQATARYGT